MSQVRRKVDNTGKTAVEATRRASKAAVPLGNPSTKRRMDDVQDLRRRLQTKAPPIKMSKGPGTAAIPVSPEDVAKRAYELFLARGGGHGHALDDWTRAERELLGPPHPRI